uniref:Secreted protein n=1 Tax=Zea mays TaxID=4577 RepID=C4J591_MAIZE|nr:unknown [Zea mays]
MMARRVVVVVVGCCCCAPTTPRFSVAPWRPACCPGTTSRTAGAIGGWPRWCSRSGSQSCSCPSTPAGPPPSPGRSRGSRGGCWPRAWSSACLWA